MPERLPDPGRADVPDAVDRDVDLPPDAEPVVPGNEDAAPEAASLEPPD